MTGEELADLAEAAARILTGGAGPKALAQLLADASRGCVLVEDDQWRHLALATSDGVAARFPPSIEPFLSKKPVADGNVARAKIDDETAALCAAMGGGPDGDGIAGYVTLFVGIKAAPACANAVRIVASALAVECLRRGAGRSQARRVFWERYLKSGFADLAALKDEAAAAGISPAPSYAVALFDLEGPSGAAARESLANALTPADAVCPPVNVAGNVVVLFPVRHQSDVARARQAAANAIRDLTAQGAVRSITCGFGGFHADALEAARALSQARQALALGRRLVGKASVTLYADLGVHALLHFGGDREAFAKFADAAIEPLVAYDRKHKTELFKTLRLYFDVGENVKEAAERLSVHRHTIFYRLNQIAQILKVDLRSPKDQLGVRAALAIRQMHADEE